MSKIKITIETESITITEVFDEKISGSPRKILIAALEWLTLGTEFQIKERGQ